MQGLVNIGAVLSSLEPEGQIDVAVRIVTLRIAAPDVIAKLDRWLDGRRKTASEILDKLDEWSGLRLPPVPAVLEELDEWLAGRPVSGVNVTEQGVEALQRILAYVDRETEANILHGLAERDSVVADAVGCLPFVFEDIPRLSDRAIQRIIREANRLDLALALTTANDDVLRCIYGNMSRRAAAELQDDVAMIGPDRLPEIAQARRAIVDLIRGLEANGTIVMSRWDEKGTW